MADSSTAGARRAARRPGTMRLIDALGYRLPVAGVVSILHRASGALMFALLPFVVWLFDVTLSSEASYERFTAAYALGLGGLPAWAVKLVTLALIWAYLHHAIAGIRHLWMDATHSVTKEQGRSSAIATLAISAFLTLGLMGKLFGWY
ncbi:MAG: succinate dehydrogenase, cytochrome b556 subunit [Rubrivivax sp.]|nr:succinate dehydrogenase, cytochrome b556 subunit [Rubrivivax sp.]